MSSAADRGVVETCDRALLFRIRAPVPPARPSESPERSGLHKRRNGRQWRLLAEVCRRFGYGCFWLQSRLPSATCLFHGPHRFDKGADFSGIFFAGFALDAGGNVHAPGVENVDRFLHIAGTQATRDDQFADAVDDSGPGLDAFPVELLPSAATPFVICGIEQDAGDHSGAEAVRFEEEVSIFGDMNFVHAFPLVGLVRLDQSGRDRIPADSLFSRRVENLCRIATENRRAAGLTAQFPEKRPAEFWTLVAAQLHRRQSRVFGDVAYAVNALIDENADLLHLPRYLGHDRAHGFQSDMASALRIKNEAQRVCARIGGGESVVEVRDPADFDPSHKDSCQRSVASCQ